jgi:hypothetical protein
MDSAESPYAVGGPRSLDDLGTQIISLAGRLASARCRWLLMVAEFDVREGCAAFGLSTTPRWLAHYCGISLRTAVDHVRVARALQSFPDLAAAMSAGRLSYSHVRAICRAVLVPASDPPPAELATCESGSAEPVIGDPVATPSQVAAAGGMTDVPRDPVSDQVVADLIAVAEHGTISQTEIMVRGLRTVENNEQARLTGSRPEEYVRHSWSEQAQLRTSARLDPERGELLQSAIATVARVEQISPADALVRLAELALVAMNDSANPPRALRGDERAAVVVHLNVADVPADLGGAEPADGEVGLRSPASATPPRSIEPAHGSGPISSSASDVATPASIARIGRPVGRIHNGPGLPDAVLLRLICAGRVRTALHGEDGSLLDLGRSHRVVSARMFRALIIRDEGHCSHPGCTTATNLEAHHVRHWLWGGATDLANLVLLCQRHHKAHHDGEFSIIPLGSGGFRFRRADGTELPVHVDPSVLIDTDIAIELEHADVAPAAATPQWNGDLMDRPWAVGVLADRREHARREQQRRRGPRLESRADFNRPEQPPERDYWAS